MTQRQLVQSYNIKVLGNEIWQTLTGENSAAIAGMWVTLVNEATPKQLTECMEKSPKVQYKIIPSMVNKQGKKAEENESNMCRSLIVSYEKGLLSKKKYKAVCRNIQTTFGEGISTPKLVYYDELIAFIKSINLDDVHDFAGTFCNAEASKFEKHVNGSYRDFCSYIITLAELYILVDQALGAESFFSISAVCPIILDLPLGQTVRPLAKTTKRLLGSCLFLILANIFKEKKITF